LNVDEAEERLREYLLDGIATEILWADQTYALAEEIGKYAQRINAANFGELFGSLQLILSERQTLAVVKIFDPAKNYSTRSIPGALALLENNADLWNVYDRERLYQELIEAGLDSTCVERMGNAELTRAVVACFRDTLPNPKRVSFDYLSLSLNILRQSRDKTIAHNESMESSALQTPTWGDANSLVNYAKEFVGTVEAGYLGLIFGEGSDDYILTNGGAHRTSMALRRLPKEAGIVPDVRR
jgi:hypothetical protein